MEKIQVEVILPGTYVEVLSKRSKTGRFKSAKVLDSEVHFREDGSWWPIYRVKYTLTGSVEAYVFEDKIRTI